MRCQTGRHRYDRRSLCARLFGRGDPEAAPWGADALTVSPYLGRDTLEPFIQVAKERGGGLYVLVRTSNPGAASFQDPSTDGLRLYERVANAVETANLDLLTADLSGGQPYGPVGAVVGATYPQELVQLRARMPHAPILVPGYGAQGERRTMWRRRSTAKALGRS